MAHNIFVILGVVFSVLFRLVFRLRRGRRWHNRTRRNWNWALNQIAAQLGGTLYEDGRRIGWQSEKAQIEVRTSGRSHSRVDIRIPKGVPFWISFDRIPGPVHAFVESFLKPEQRIGNEPFFIRTNAPEKLEEIKRSPSLAPLLGQLSRYGFSVQANGNGVTLTRRISNRRMEDYPYLELLRLAQSLADVCSGAFAEMPLQEVSTDQHCAYCKESIGDGAPVTSCAVCRTPHHQECFHLNGGCSVFGCRSRQYIEPPLVTMNQ